MKQRISDLLDEIMDDSVEMETRTPLSSRRIKELTMAKMTKKKGSRRVLPKMLLAAAIIAVLTITALAAEEMGAGDWFRDIFAGRGAEETELEQQLSFIDSIGQVYQQSMTSEGTTITPIAGFGDENVFYLRLRLAGPEGTVLPDGAQYKFLGKYDQERWVVDNPEELNYELTVLPDQNQKDNEKEFLIRVIALPDSGRKLNDGNPLPLYISGLYQEITTESGSNELQKVLSGDFTLDLVYYNHVEMTELDVNGLSYHRKETGISIDLQGREQEIPYEYTATLSSMKISPISISWTCSYEMSDPTWKAGLDVQIVMKDGSKVSMRCIGSGYDEDHHFAASMGAGIFDVPIELEQVDYILIGSEHKVYLP